MINTSNLEKAKALINKVTESKEKPIIVKAQNPEFNRGILEYRNFQILLDPHIFPNSKDKIKFLDSGLNHVLAKIAAKNNIAIGIDLEEIRKSDKKEKSLALARIKQNIKICRKAKTKLKLLNYMDKRTAFSFLISLGASTQQAKEAVES